MKCDFILKQVLTNQINLTKLFTISKKGAIEKQEMV